MILALSLSLSVVVLVILAFVSVVLCACMPCYPFLCLPQEINLAGNRIGSFRCLNVLRRMQNLQSVCLDEPHFGPNPLCLLCNYQVGVCFILPPFDFSIFTTVEWILNDCGMFAGMAFLVSVLWNTLGMWFFPLQTYALYALPRVTFLDTKRISEEARRLADATVIKKRMYVIDVPVRCVCVCVCV